MCMMSEGQMSTQCPHPSHLVMYTKVGMNRLLKNLRRALRAQKIAYRGGRRVLSLIMPGGFALDAEAHVHGSVLQQFHGVSFLLLRIVARLQRQVLGRAVGA